MLQDRDPLDAAGGRQGHAGQPSAVWPAVPARRLWTLRSARCSVTEGPAARCESTRSRSVRARMCARRLTRPSSMTMRSASARASGFLPWSFPRPGSRCCLADISTGSATLQRSPFAARGVCGGHPKTRRCARPVRWSTGRFRRTAGAPRLPAGHATARPALPGTPGALDVPPRGWPDTNVDRPTERPEPGASSGGCLRPLVNYRPRVSKCWTGPISSVRRITGGPGRSLVPGVTLRRHTPRLGRHRPDPKGASAGRGRSAGSRRPGFDGGQRAADDTHGAAGRRGAAGGGPVRRAGRRTVCGVTEAPGSGCRDARRARRSRRSA